MKVLKQNVIISLDNEFVLKVFNLNKVSINLTDWTLSNIQFAPPMH